MHTCEMYLTIHRHKNCSQLDIGTFAGVMWTNVDAKQGRYLCVIQIGQILDPNRAI